MKFFHRANIVNLLIDDKFAKVPPFLNIFKKNFLASSHAFRSTDVKKDEMVGALPNNSFVENQHTGDTRNGWLLYHLAMLLRLIYIKHRLENQTRYRNQFGVGGEVMLDFLDNSET